MGTFQLEKKKDGGNDVKGDDASGSGSLLPSPSGGTESLHVYHPSMESSGRNLNNEHHTMTSGGALGGGAHFMMQPPQGMHMSHARPSEWGGAGYDLSGNKNANHLFIFICIFFFLFSNAFSFSKTVFVCVWTIVMLLVRNERKWVIRKWRL